MKATLLVIITLIYSSFAFGQEADFQINNFEIKESLTSNSKIAIIATDSLDQAKEHINGTYKFTINGFEQNLAFHGGVATPIHPIEGSTFVYFKHKNQDKSTGKLYFLYKKDTEITPIKINGLLLIIIPAILLLIAYTFKRLLSTFVVLAIVYGYFSFSKGLSVGHILESAYEIVKKII
ncbi:hypothetical protein [Sphingobacterium rhinopitheci]|uniref:hypothetical protein n=1 Tax=Sphingobacterium rhinopitheci TaxID=2781960 RepID=UPI001F51CDD9|nr:hypothetical protein [Sphingobacterium rhinopitheci]MCI0920009.1 hypothetical protein [Sphingobacterium rhinopitheci]